MERILRERDDWLRSNGIDVSQPEWREQLLGLSEQHQCTFRRAFATSFEPELDALHGSCLMREPKLARIVAGSLHKFDDARYLLSAYVVMPNQLHVLARIFPDRTMLQQCYSWKHFQASELNKATNQSGSVFQSESFDHLVRDDHLGNFRKYFADNPRKAKLSENEYLLYLPDM